MVINLQKGQRISLTKEAPQLQQLMCGLGWDVATKKGGFLSGLFSQNNGNFDLDASVICISENKKVKHEKDVVYFGNLRHYSSAIMHQGDNLTGEGNGDDEQIMINLALLPEYIYKIAIVVNIYDPFNRQQDFAQINNAFIRLVNLTNQKEIVRYTLSGAEYTGQTAMIMAELTRNGKDWEMDAKGEGLRVKDLAAVVNLYNQTNS
ncbi:TerD family protein [Cyanobacterium stanieri LEGE 03274]|uniref:TerD family protein n=1 Tax=Cyanobacterium stanieri LEGE 03274 TaxID=1828756 RepID=A0ABR9V4I5_9CHRO|nr:TerD family protein [Cyanobacterium stanieri]MBE9222800.1 TerD family protein [Cyanobacterium stanieri LEGE 03274]